LGGIIARRSFGAFERGSRPPDEEPLVLVFVGFSRAAGRSAKAGSGRAGKILFFYPQINADFLRLDSEISQESALIGVNLRITAPTSFVVALEWFDLVGFGRIWSDLVGFGRI